MWQREFLNAIGGSEGFSAPESKRPQWQIVMSIKGLEYISRFVSIVSLLIEEKHRQFKTNLTLADSNHQGQWNSKVLFIGHNAFIKIVYSGGKQLPC